MAVDFNYLRQRQSLPLEAKEVFSEQRIREFYEQMEGKVYVAYSGGKDSTVMLHLIRKLYPNVPAVFSNTGMEYPEIVQHVRKTENVIWIRPKKKFIDIVKDEGWPVLSKVKARAIKSIRCPTGNNDASINFWMTGVKRDGTKSKNGITLPPKWHYLIEAPFKISDKCCDFLKKDPVRVFQKETGLKPYVGILASDSRIRTGAYLTRGGCNSISEKAHNIASWPLGIWEEKDVWGYIKKYNLEYASIYDKGLERTGCMFCLFGIHLEKGENRIQRMARLHPKLWKYYMGKTDMRQVMDYLGFPCDPII